MGSDHGRLRAGVTGALVLALASTFALAGCGGKHKKHDKRDGDADGAKGKGKGKGGDKGKDGKDGKEVHAHDLGLLPVDPWAKAPTSDCQRLPFAESIPVAEASGAVMLQGPEGAELLVIGDSGTSGAYVEIAADDGRVLRSGALPLGDGAGDDLEGITTDGALIWGLTSGGWMRAWQRDGTGFRLAIAPYPLEKHGPCKHDGVNCGHDFEGLCLRPDGKADDAGCIGYAAARAEGTLYCLTREDDRVVLALTEGYQSARPGPKVTKRRFLADCAIGADGAVWTGDNLLGSAMVRRLGEPVWKGALGDGFPEALTLAPGGIVYRFSDTGSAPSLARRYHCPAADVAAGAATITAPPIAAARADRDDDEP
jgi:hypothetical protein